MIDRMDKMVRRFKSSQNFEQMKALFEADHPGLGEKADLLFACASLAGTLTEEHPDLQESPRVVADLALALFESQTATVVDLSPEGEDREEEGAKNSGISTGKIEVGDP